MSWKPLPLPASAGLDLPPLLISSAFQKDTYTIHVTDLTHIWTEILDRAAIISRSREESTSVDPGSSPDQFAIFLEKIKLGLAGGTGTTCALTVGAEDEGRASLGLRVTVNLPGGLAPLEWPIQLRVGSDSEVTNHLTLPLLRAQRTLIKEIEGLKETIRDKDHVIEKVVDKMESSGIDLGQVFAQAVGKPGKKGDWHRERVKGMTAFDWDAWKQKFIVESDGTKDLVNDIFGTDEPYAGIFGEPQDEDAAEDWWSDIQGLNIDLRTGKISTNRRSKKDKSTFSKAPMPLPEAGTAAEDTADEANSRVIGKGENDTTDDRTRSPTPEQNKSPSRTRSPTPLKAQPKPKAKLGKLGGKKKVQESDPVTASSAVAGTEAEDEPDKESASKSLSKELTREPVSKKKKFGQIGGKKKQNAESTMAEKAEPQPEPDVEPEPETKLDAADPAHTPVKKRLGIIGHKKNAAPSQQGGDVEEHIKNEDTASAEVTERGRGRVKSERSPTPPPRETSTERADRKREQLRKELEQKAKAPPKKKRKL